MRIVVLFILLAPLVSNGQYKLKGFVRDSVTRETMPGVNVIIENQNKGTVTDENGEFELESKTASAQVTFSFIGFNTIIRTMHATLSDSIDLTYEEEENSDRFIKANLELGYFGDKQYAPYGAMLNFSLQSVGKKSVGLTSTLKYWKEQKNAGLEFSIGKNIHIAYFPQNILLNYKTMKYTGNRFELKQARGLFSYKLPRFFAIDFGGAYNDLMSIDQQENLTKERHVTGSIGVTKIFSYDSFLRNCGFYSSLNYNPHWTYYEIGTYKELPIKNITSFVIMAKYYNYGTFDGILFSIRFNIFDTRYYCCHSWAVYSDDINALK
jgi:hypothetical protein